MEEYRFLIVFIDIILPFLLGLWLKRAGLSPEWMRLLIKTNVVPVTTALSVISFWSVHLDPVLVLLPLSVIPICFIPVLYFYAFESHRFADPREKGSYLVSIMMGNIGTMAGLCGYILFGESGFAYIQLIGMPQVLIFVLYCFPMAQYYYAMWKNQGKGERPHLKVREMLFTWNQLPAVGVVIGMTLGYFDVTRPAAVGTAFSCLIHLSAWLGMISVGYGTSLSGAMRYMRRLWVVFPVKFIMMPLLMYFFVKCFTDNQQVIACILLASAAPTAIFSVMTAQLYDLSVDLAESSLLGTTIFFLFCIYPLVYWYITSGGTF